MQLKQAEIQDRISRVVTGIGRCVMSAPAMATLALMGNLPDLAKAASVPPVEVYLIASHSTPAPSTTAPFAIETTKVYQLSDFNSNFNARQLTLVENFTFSIDTALTFSSDLNMNTDSGEIGAGTENYVNAEVGTWNNVNIPNSGTYDSGDQLEFGRNSRVVFNPIQGGFTDLVIAELGGFNPFGLGLCSDGACSTFNRFFGGINSRLEGNIFNLPEFAINDSNVESEMHQTWLFRFGSRVFDYVGVVEDDDRNFYTNARLQVDFIGAGGVTPSTVPLPTGLPLLASGLALMLWPLRRRGESR